MYVCIHALCVYIHCFNAYFRCGVFSNSKMGKYAFFFILCPAAILGQSKGLLHDSKTGNCMNVLLCMYYYVCNQDLILKST